MKKKIGIVIIFICGILAFFVPYFFSNSWRKVACKRGEIHSDIYEREDVEHAMTLVEQTFPQEMLDCKMTKLSYDESAYRQFADSFRKQKSDDDRCLYGFYYGVQCIPYQGSYTGAQCGIYSVSMGIATLLRAEGVGHHRFGIWFFVYRRGIKGSALIKPFICRFSCVSIYDYHKVLYNIKMGYRRKKMVI